MRNTMKRLLSLSLALASLSTAAWATDRTVTLEVSGTTCAACPLTVQTALSRAPGVERIEVNSPPGLVTVRYDDAKTSIAALEKVTTDAGYPSKPVRGVPHA